MSQIFQKLWGDIFKKYHRIKNKHREISIKMDTFNFAVALIDKRQTQINIYRYTDPLPHDQRQKL